MPAYFEVLTAALFLVVTGLQLHPDRTPTQSFPSVTAVPMRLVVVVTVDLFTHTMFSLFCLQAREVHQFCTLVGYGADAICPYLAYEGLFALHETGKLPATYTRDEIVARYIK